jgi:hypothetical protein
VKVSSRAGELFDAIQDDDATSVAALLRSDPALLEARGTDRQTARKTPLMWALQCNRFALARTLIRRGADVRAHWDGPHHVISLALMFMDRLNPDKHRVERLALLDELIDAGADPDDGWFPAVHSGTRQNAEHEIYELLLRRGASPDYRVHGTSTVRELITNNARHYSSRMLALFGVPHQIERVRHPTFGTGDVVARVANGKDTFVEVQFETGERKKLLARFVEPAD